MQGEDVNVVDNFNIKSENNLKPEFIAEATLILTVKTQGKSIKYCVQRGSKRTQSNIQRNAQLEDYFGFTLNN